MLYREYVNDEWGSLFESMYGNCRERWQYRVPENSAERDELRYICQRALGFENHFLTVYKRFVLSELRNADVPVQMHALWVQAQIPFVDPEIMAAVRELCTCENEELRQPANKAQHALESHRD